MLNEIKCLNSVIFKDYLYRHSGNKKLTLSDLKVKHNYLYFYNTEGIKQIIQLDQLASIFNIIPSEFKKLIIKLRQNKSIQSIEFKNKDLLVLTNNDQQETTIPADQFLGVVSQ